MNRTKLALCIALLAAGTLLGAQDAHATDVFGAISTDTTWDADGSPYVLTADVVVQADVTLTIDPGVVVQVQNGSSGDIELVVNGTLSAVGAEGQPVAFTAESDQTAGSWEGIRFAQGASALLQDVTIDYADFPLEFDTPDAANFVIDGVTIRHYGNRGVNTSGAGSSLNLGGLDIEGDNTGYGVYSTDTTLMVDRSRFISTRVGVYVSNANLDVTWSVFADNTSEGIRSAVSLGAYVLDVDHCTFYNNVDAIEVSRSRYDRYLDYYVDWSLFGNNTNIVRDSATYDSTFQSFTHNVHWGGGMFNGSDLPSTESDNLGYNGLLVDPEAGDFAPTDRSPARYFGPADPMSTIGGVPFAGAETGAGIHGFWYENRTFASLSSTDVGGDVVITAGFTMTFEPGASFNMATSDQMQGGLNKSLIEIRVEGTLEADGTNSRPVLFTSAAAEPARGDWYGIVIPANAQAFNVAQVDIGHAFRGVSLYNNDHIVAGSTIHDSSGYGVYIEGGTPELEQLDLYDNGTGVYVVNASSLQMRDVDAWGNDGDGLYASNSSLSWDRGVVRDNGDNGLELEATLRNASFTADLTHLTIAHNVDSGLEVERSRYDRYLTVTLDSSSVTHNADHGVRDIGSYDVTFNCDNSNIWGNTSGRITGLNLSRDSCFEYNPLYVDADNRNYAPTTWSPNRKLGTGGGVAGAREYGGVDGPELMGYLWDGYTFTEADSPHTILGDVVVPSGVTVLFEPGARLEVAAGTDGMVGGQSNNRSELNALDGSTLTFNGSGERIVLTSDSPEPSPGDWFGVTATNATTSTFDNVQIDYGRYGLNLPGPGAPATIEDVWLRFHSTAGIYAENVTTSPGLDVLAARVVGNGSGTGIYAYSSNARIRSSYITHHRTGIQVYQPTRNATRTAHLINNTVVHHRTGVLYERTRYDRYLNLTVQNNIIAHNTSYALQDAGSYSTSDQVEYNNFFDTDNTTGSFDNATGNITSDPLIEDDDWEAFPRWWDGKVWKESLVINGGSGSVAQLPDRDITGKARNFAGGVDIGAFEHDPDANEEPRADAVEDSLIVPRGEAFTFDGSAALDPDGFIASAYWTMSDGTVTPGITVEHTFADEGENQWGYLTVLDDQGAEDHVLVTVNVDIRPIADAGPAVFQDEGPDESVFFDGTLSSDPDGTVVDWAWDFGDGNTSTETSPRHSYLSAGIYTVTLTVTDNEGLTHTDTTTATVFGNEDTVGPNVTHNELPDGQPVNTPVTVRATIQDPAGVANAVLFYRPIGGSAAFAAMMDVGSNVWEGVIPAGAVTSAGVEYWITAADAIEPEPNTSTTPTGAPTEDVWDFLVSGDTDAPNIDHTPIADGQDSGVAVTVSATITDATGVSEAVLRFRPIGGDTFGQVQMNNIGGDTWSAQIPGFIVSPPGVEYHIEAMDSSPIPNTGVAPAGAPGSNYSFTVGGGDTDAPIISHAPVTDGQPEGAEVTITASIIDNVGVDAATLYFRVSGAAAFTSAAMTNPSGSSWRGVIPAGSVTTAGVDYYISAADAAPNTATEPDGAPGSFHSFTVSTTDMVAPAIVHSPVPNGQPEGEDVTVTATVTDSSGLEAVTLYYQPVGLGFFQSISMTADGDTWTGTIPGFAVSSQGIEYYIRAIDASDESNTAYAPETAPGTPYQFTVGTSDETAPTIAHTPVADGQTAGQDLLVETAVFDTSGVDAVSLFYRPSSGGDFTELSMTLSGQDRYTATIPGADVVAPGLSYYIEASDASGVSNTGTEPETAPTELLSFTVVEPDTDAPVITHVASDADVTYGEDVVIDASVSDASALESVTLWVALDDGDFEAIEMTGADGDYTATIPSGTIVNGTATVSYYIEATDAQGNSATSPAGGADAPVVRDVFYPDVVAPEVVVSPISGPIATGSDVPVSVEATDASEITSVTLYYRVQGTMAWRSLSLAGDGPYTGTISGDEVTPPGLEIYAEASDSAGNAGQSETLSVTVEDPPDLTPPSVTLTPVSDGQLEGAAVTVAASITDESGVASAILYYRAEGAGSFEGTAMALTSGSTWTAQIPGDAVAQPAVEYYVAASDAADAGNTATAPADGQDGPARFTVSSSDAVGPQIAHTPEAGPLAEGLELTVDAVITDASGVLSATVEWRTEGEDAATSVEMTQGDGDTYSATIGPLATPGVEYRVIATDSADNEATAPEGGWFSVEVVVADTEPPTIDHTPIAENQPEGQPVAIEATITDESGVTSASVFYRLIGNETFGEAAMSRDGDAFSATIPGVIIVAPGVEYYIAATDGADPANTGSSPAGAPDALHIFGVGDDALDTAAPVIDHSELEEAQVAGEAVALEATITDDSGVSQATLFFRQLGEESWLSTNMSDAGDDTWTANVTASVVAAPGVEYYIVAVDGSTLANQAVAPAAAPDEAFSFTVGEGDAEGPTIDVEAVDSPQPEGTPVPVVATVTDPAGVDRVELMYQAEGDAGWVTLSMSDEGSDMYTATIDGGDVAPDAILYFVEAEDALGNVSYGPAEGPDGPLSFDVDAEVEEDTTAPTIVHSPVSSTVEGRAISLQAVITDASGIGDALVWFRTGGTDDWALVPLMAGDDNRFSGSIPGSATSGATVEYYLEASDASDAENTATDPADAPDGVYVVEVLPSGGNNGTNNGSNNGTGGDNNGDNNDTGNNATNNGGTNNNTGGFLDDEDDDGGSSGSPRDEGCGCSATAGGAPSAWWLVLVGLVVGYVVRRRR